MIKTTTLPLDIIRLIYTFDPTYRYIYNKIMKEINKLPKISGIYYTTKEENTSETQVEFVFHKPQRKHHIFCIYQCYLNMLFFHSVHKYSEEKSLYLRDYSIYCTPHNYSCQEIRNYNNSLFSNEITTVKDYSCL